MTDEQFYIDRLLHRGIKPTATRLLILREMFRGDETVSLPQLERLLPTVDKSTISRTLSVFLMNKLIHVVDDGSGSLKYNVCSDDCDCGVDDEHTHFYCEPPHFLPQAHTCARGGAARRLPSQQHKLRNKGSLPRVRGERRGEGKVDFS